MFDLINEIIETLRHNKLRTALTGFAVSWGIFLLIVLLSVSRGLVNGMEAMFSQRDTEAMSVSGGWALKPYKGLKDDRPISIVGKDMQILETQLGDKFVAGTSAEISSDSSKVSTTKDYITQGYTGVFPAALRTEGAKIESGRFINDADVKGSRRVIVIHKDNAPTLFGKQDPVGKMVKVGDLSFTVVGVYTHEWNRRSFIPYSVAKSMAGGSDTIRRMMVNLKGLKTVEDGERAEQEVRATLSRQHQFDPTDESAVWIWNRFTQHLTTASAMNVLSLAVWVIGILTMLSGIVGVSNIMFVSVRERTHEIGVKRAIGARPMLILRQIMMESVAITTFFGYIGIVAGIAVAQLIGSLTAGATGPGPGDHPLLKDPSISIGMALEVTAVLIIAGALAGLFPALKSLKIKPVEALRDE